MKYDCDHEAKACANELYYRDGPQPKDLTRLDAKYVQETIKQYLSDAWAAGNHEARLR